MSETYYGAVNDFRGYLKHHGIKGQKWGKRNGPPYPLSASDHSKREQKAGWRSSLSRKVAGGEDAKKEKPPKSDYWVNRNNKKKQMDYIRSTYDKKDLKRIKKDLKFDRNVDTFF